MAYNNSMKFLILFSVIFAYSFAGNAVTNVNYLPYESIFNFGDSLSDTGNEATLHPPMSDNSPYGSTYFKHPSGRLSNGRLIIDFIGIFIYFLYIHILIFFSKILIQFKYIIF
jgi:phospholipase/lecithinase/hemolysin